MIEILILFLLTVVVLTLFFAVMTWRGKRHPGHSGCGCQHHHSDEGCQCGDSDPNKVTILEQMPPNTP